MRRSIGKECVLALLVTATGTFALWETWDLNLLSAIFPQTVGGILAGLGLFHLVGSLLRPVVEQRNGAGGRRRGLLLIASMAVYVVLIPMIGFLMATLMFTGFTVWALQGGKVEPPRRVGRAVLFSIAISTGCFLLFRYVFLVPFPAGIWGSWGSGLL